MPQRNKVLVRRLIVMAKKKTPGKLRRCGEGPIKNSFIHDDVANKYILFYNDEVNNTHIVWIASS